MTQAKLSQRNSHRIIIHFDYDCFYASVFEHENPALRSVPLAVQQKQIIVTCNYTARRLGLRKLQLIAEAKRIVPDVVIVLGEDLGRFRDASKLLYDFLKTFSWNGKVERLGFDEVFLDVSDIVEFNESLLNSNNLAHSFFQIDRHNTTAGFKFDATIVAGHQFPSAAENSPPANCNIHTETALLKRLILGSHLAEYIRLKLEAEKGYTSTVGISTNKLLSKLVGNLNKPKGQTTLMPPYTCSLGDKNPDNSNVVTFIDDHEVGKIPGIGFQRSNRIRNHILSRPSEFSKGLIYGETRDPISVRDVRLFSGMGPELLESLLGVPGAERGIGGKVWRLMNGVDETEVKQAKKHPSQISIENSYLSLETMPQVLKELEILATSLVKRMHTDLLEDDEEAEFHTERRWIAHPKTIRLSTRLKSPKNPRSTRNRSFNRISKSSPLPNMIFNLKDNLEVIVEGLVQETLVPMFKKLHPIPSGWNLSLVNICVTNMLETASGVRDISEIFKRQSNVPKELKIEDQDVTHSVNSKRVSKHVARTTLAAESGAHDLIMVGSEDVISFTQTTADELGVWEEEEDDGVNRETCNECGASMPVFAMNAHQRFHIES